MKTCILCGKELEDDGCDAQPIAEGRCCAKCNTDKVMPERIKRM